MYTVSTQLNILDTKLIVSEENPQPLFINPVPIMMSPPHLLKPGRVSLLRLQHNWDASSFSPFVGLDVSLPGRQNNIQVNLERKKNNNNTDTLAEPISDKKANNTISHLVEYRQP